MVKPNNNATQRIWRKLQEHCAQAWKNGEIAKTGSFHGEYRSHKGRYVRVRVTSCWSRHGEVKMKERSGRTLHARCWPENRKVRAKKEARDRWCCRVLLSSPHVPTMPRVAKVTPLISQTWSSPASQGDHEGRAKD